MREPLLGKSLRQAYEREIVGLIKKMRPSWTSLVRSAHDLLNAGKGSEFEYLVHQIFQESFVSPSRKIAKKNALKAYLSGQSQARARLKGIGVGAAVGPLPPDPKVLDILNTRNISALMGVSDDLAKRIKQSLTESVMLGEGTNASAKRMDDNTKIGIKRARLVARTEIAYAQTAAQIEEFKRFGIARVEWIAAPDVGQKRPCPKCKKLDGKEFDIDKHPDCPLHPNCRCTLEAISEEV